MRRSILAAIIVTLMLLVGCDAEAPTPVRLTPPPTASPFPSGSPVPARILTRGYLVVGIRYDLSPFCYITEEGAPAGFDVDLARELARRWLGDPEAVQFRQVRSDTAAEHVQAGDVDLALAALIHTVGQEEQIDFGTAYFEDGHALLVRSTDAMSITAPVDLEGLIVGVADDQAGAALASTVPFTPTVQSYAAFDQALEALVSGEVDAVTDLRRRLVRGLFEMPGTSIVGQYTEAMVAPAFAHNQPGLDDLMRVTMQDMYLDGTYQELYERWFPRDEPLSMEVLPGAVRLSLEEAQGIQSTIDTLAAVRTGGWLRVAMVGSRSPFAYLDVNGAPAGYEVRLVRTLAQRWLGDPTAVEFLPVLMEEGLRLLQNGEVDMLIGAVPHTLEAEQRVDFSLTTYVAGEGLLVLAGSAPDGFEGLNGQSVAVVSGTGSADVLGRISQEMGFSVIALPKATLDEAIVALQAGEVAAVAGERVDLLGPAFATYGIGVTADRLTRTPLGLALPPGDSAFRDLVNITLQTMAREGQLAAIYAEWFDDDPPGLESWPGDPSRPLRIEVILPPQ